MRHCRDASLKARRDGKAGGQDSRARRPACAGSARAAIGARPMPQRACTFASRVAVSGSFAMSRGVARHPRRASWSDLLPARRAAVASSGRFASRSVAFDPRCGAYRPALAIAMSASLASAQAREARSVRFVRRDGGAGSQPIADVLADVTVIGAAEIARAGAQSLTELAAAAAGRGDHPERRPRLAVRDLPARRQPRADAGAGRRHPHRLVERRRDFARGDSARPDRPHRDPARTGVEPLRRGRDRRRRAGVHAARHGVLRRQCERRATAPTARGTSKAACPARRGRSPSRCRAAAKASDGFNAVVDPSSFLYNGDKDGYKNQSVSASAGYTFAPEQELTAQFFRSHLNSQFDGGPGFDDRTITVAETWQVASRNRLAPFWVSRLSAGAGIDDSKTESAFDDFPFKTTQRQYAWQNEFTLPLGMLTAGFERREEHLATDCRLRRDGPRHEFAVRHLPAAHRRPRAAGESAPRRFEPVRRQDDRLHRLRLSLRHRRWRVTAGYSTGFKAPSFNDLYYPGFSNPDLVPETSKNLEGGIYWNGSVAAATRGIARHRLSKPGVAAHHFQCDADFNCAPHNVNRAHARRRDARPRSPRRQRRDARGVARHPVAGGRSSPASSCRDGRGGTAH